MSQSEIEIKRKRAQIKVFYEELPLLEKKIVQLFSVIYEPISKTQFFNCLTKTGALDKGHQSLTAEKQVLAAIEGVAEVVTVHSDIGGGTIDAEFVTAQTIPHVHLLPSQEGLKVSFLACPFGSGAYYRPGTGGETVIAEINQRRLQTQRNLEEEKLLTNNAISACPTLTRIEVEDSEWQINNPEDCLELLLEQLHHHKRDLADSLLEGASISGKMSTEVLLELMGT